MDDPLPDSADVPLDPFRDPAAWRPVPRRKGMLRGPEGMVLRLFRNRDTLRAALSVPVLEACPHRGGLWRGRKTLGTEAVQAALLPGPADDVLLRIADLAWGGGARETRALLGRVAQVLAEQERSPDPQDTDVAEAAEIAFTARGAALRARRRNAFHPGPPFHGAWRDLPPRLAARTILAVPPRGGHAAALRAAAVPDTAHGRLALRVEARREIAALGDDPALLFGDAP